MVCDYVSSTAKTNNKLGTLPAGCRPARTVLGMAYPRGSNSSGQITVKPDGEVSLYTFEGSSCYVGVSVNFPLPYGFGDTMWRRNINRTGWSQLLTIHAD